MYRNEGGLSTHFFKKQQVSSMFKEFHNQDPRINIHDLQMFTQKKVLNRVEKEDIKYLITAMKIMLHNNYKSKRTRRDYTRWEHACISHSHACV